MQIASTEEKQYLDYASQFRLLRAEEEVEYFIKIEAGFEACKKLRSLDNPTPEILQTLIDFATAHRVVQLSNLRLVATLARKRARYNMVPYADLILEGNFGLNSAIARFDYEKGIKFSTYATGWINQTICRALPDQGRLIRIPVYAHEDWLKLAHVIPRLKDELGRSPTEAEIAADMDIEVEQVKRLMTLGKPQLLSLDKPLFSEGTDTLADIISDESRTIDMLTDSASNQAEVVRLFGAKSPLSYREKVVLALRYGLLDNLPAEFGVAMNAIKIDDDTSVKDMMSQEGMTRSKLAEILGTSKEGARTLERRALRAARSILTKHTITG